MGKRQTCCCGCSAKFGTSFLLCCSMVWCIVAMYGTNYHIEKLMSNMFEKKTWLFQDNFSKIFLMNLFIFIMIISAVGIYGMWIKNRSLLMPYIIYRIISNVVMVIAIFPLMLNVLMNPQKYSSWLSRIGPFVGKLDHRNNSNEHIFIMFIIVELSFIAMEVHFLKVLFRYHESIETSTSKMVKNEIMTLSNLRGLSTNGKFYSIPDSEISTAV